MLIVPRVLLLSALLVSWVVSANPRTKQTLAKAKEIAARKLVGAQIGAWGDYGAIVEGVRLPTPLVHDWSELRRHTLRQETPLINLKLELVVLDAEGKRQRKRRHIALAEITELHNLAIGEVVAIADPRGVAEMLIARTLDTNYEDDWRVVLVEMQVLAAKQGGRGKETQAIEPELQLVHEDELLFRD